MKTRPLLFAKLLRNESDPATERIRIPLLFLILLLFAAAPAFAQDADADETETEEVEEEIEEVSDEESGEEAGEEISGQTKQTEKSMPAAEKRPRCVLMLLPFSSSYAEHVYVSNTISRHVASLNGSYVVMQKEFDMLNVSQSELQSKFESLKPLLDGGDIAVIIGIGQELLPLLARNIDLIPEKTALLLFSEKKPLETEFAGHENFGGVFLNNPAEKSLDLIFQVFPGTKRVIPLAGRTETGRRFVNEVRDALKESHPDAECVFIDNSSVDTPEMIQRVKQCGKDSAVLFHSWYGLDAVNLASLSFFLQRLCLNPDVPVFAVHDSMFVFPVAGGAVCPSEASVDKLNEMLDSCLVDEASLAGKWETVEAKSIITASSFQRFGISSGINTNNLMVSMDSRSMFRRENARTLVAVTFSVVLILAMLCYIAVTDHYRRRLLKLLRAVFKQIPSRIVVGSRNGIAHFIHVGKFGEDSGVVRFPVNELPEYADETFRHAWEEVFATGETQKFQMATGSRHRSVEMAIFEDKDIFGRDTAFWISHDVEELLQAQNELKAGLTNQEKLNDLFAASLKMLSSDATAVDMTNDVLSFIVRSVKDHMKSDYCCIMRYNYEDMGMELFADVASDTITVNEEKRFIPFPDKKDDKLMARLGNHMPVVINDFAASLFVKPDAAQAGSKRPKKVSMCISPVFIDGKLWGHLASVHQKGKYEFSDLYLQFLQGTAHVVEAMLEYRFIHSRLERGEYEKQLIMENLPLPLILLDRNLNLIQRNSAAKKDHLLGFPDALHDNLCHTVFCKAKVPPEDCPVRGVMSDLKPHVKALTFNGKDYMVNAYPILIGGELTNILLAWFDVTAENENQRKLEAAFREAKDASKAKSLFLASMSHELRTPLNAVIGFCELLQNSALPRESQLEYLKSISVAGHTLLDLISNILDTCKLETEQVELQNEKTDVRKIVTDMVSMFKSLAEKKQLAQPLVVPDDLPYVVLDRMRLRQVLVNLLGNAFKFTDKGYVGIKVTCKILEQGKCRLAIAIRDSGIGISPDKKQKVFEPFVQQDAVRDTHVYKGSGLGLAICDRYIKAMGGRIDLDSEVGKGSVFTIVFESIPYLIPTEEERAAAKDAGNASAELPANTFGGAAKTQAPVSKVDLTGYNALIVDDVPINLKVLGAMLKGFRLNIVQANSGSDALAKLPEAKPDLVLTDMWMPGMSGEELAREIRATQDGDHVVIMAVTADVENQNNFDMSVFDGILLKPVTKDSLAFAFQEMIDKGRIKPKG